MAVDIAERLSDVRRRRGWTQQQLARAAKLSVSTISKAEQGNLPLSMETVHRLARALQVSTTTLAKDPAEDGASPAVDTWWEPVRRAIVGPPTRDPALPEPTPAGLDAVFADLQHQYQRDNFAELGQLLPEVLADVGALDLYAPGARQTATHILHMAGWLLTQTRQFDAADVALERAERLAPTIHMTSAIIDTRCWWLLRTGRLDAVSRLAAEWADKLEPRMSRASEGDLAAWGSMLLRVSAASARDNRVGQADDALRLASAAAAAMAGEARPPGDFSRTFGPVTIIMKEAENEAVADRPDKVLRLAERLPLSGNKVSPTTSNVNRHRLDVARAHLTLGERANAIGVLLGVARSSPQWLPHQTGAQSLVKRILRGRRSYTPELVNLADAVGMPV